MFGSVGLINYTFYCNRPDAGTNITIPYDAQYNNVALTTWTRNCNYPSPGTYTAKVIVEQGSASAVESRVLVTIGTNAQAPITIPSPPSQSSGPGAQQIPLAPQTSSLSEGSQGEDVRLLQELLVKEGYLDAKEATGRFGPTTRTALQRFQCSAQIICTGTPETTGYGRVGPQTRTLLMKKGLTLKGGIVGTGQSAPTTPKTPATTSLLITRTLSYGAKGSDVTSLQTSLIQKGYLAPNNASGYYGNLTRAAVQKYQCAKQIVCTGNESTTGYGMVGARTRASMNGGAPPGSGSSPTVPSLLKGLQQLLEVQEQLKALQQKAGKQ